ncbi:hypothetical protein HK099_004195, partial [Clydaea vesicula]
MNAIERFNDGVNNDKNDLSKTIVFFKYSSKKQKEVTVALCELNNSVTPSEDIIDLLNKNQRTTESIFTRILNEKLGSEIEAFLIVEKLEIENKILPVQEKIKQKSSNSLKKGTVKNENTVENEKDINYVNLNFLENSKQSKVVELLFEEVKKITTEGTAAIDSLNKANETIKNLEKTIADYENLENLKNKDELTKVDKSEYLNKIQELNEVILEKENCINLLKDQTKTLEMKNISTTPTVQSEVVKEANVVDDSKKPNLKIKEANVIASKFSNLSKLEFDINIGNRKLSALIDTEFDVGEIIDFEFEEEESQTEFFEKDIEILENCDFAINTDINNIKIEDNTLDTFKENVNDNNTSNMELTTLLKAKVELVKELGRTNKDFEKAKHDNVEKVHKIEKELEAANRDIIKLKENLFVETKEKEKLRDEFEKKIKLIESQFSKSKLKVKELEKSLKEKENLTIQYSSSQELVEKLQSMNSALKKKGKEDSEKYNELETRKIKEISLLKKELEDKEKINKKLNINIENYKRKLDKQQVDLNHISKREKTSSTKPNPLSKNNSVGDKKFNYEDIPEKFLFSLEKLNETEIDSKLESLNTLQIKKIFMDLVKFNKNVKEESASQAKEFKKKLQELKEEKYASRLKKFENTTANFKNESSLEKENPTEEKKGGEEEINDKKNLKKKEITDLTVSNLEKELLFYKNFSKELKTKFKKVLLINKSLGDKLKESQPENN